MTIKNNLKLRLKESIDVPREGIFWVIKTNLCEELIAFSEQVDTSCKWSTTLEHIKIWKEIKNSYLVNDKTVPYNYFPRGRVMVNPIRINNILDHYDAYIYIDNCINNSSIIKDIKCEFCLKNNSCIIKYIGADGGITDNHYQCHNCSKNN